VRRATIGAVQVLSLVAFVTLAAIKERSSRFRVPPHLAAWRGCDRRPGRSSPRLRARGTFGVVGGAVNQGTAQIHQQLVFRPPPGLGRPDTPIRGLFLAGASAHPGGGVHGAAGANAARAALARRRFQPRLSAR
jgi:hypothetical protein